MTIRPTINLPNFDSEFEPAAAGRAARLTIKLRVTLVPLDPSANWTAPNTQIPGTAWGPMPPAHLATGAADLRRGLVLDYNNRSFPCKSWLTADWTAFKQRFKRAVEQGWNNQIILLPADSGTPGDELDDPDFRQLVSNPKVAAHVEGALDIKVMPDTIPGHALVEVAHLDQPGANFRVWMARISNESVQFSHSNSPFKDLPDAGTGQITVAHEVGHWLRDLYSTHFDHIDAKTPAAKFNPDRVGLTQATLQYGKTVGSRATIMGAGSEATSHEARPWLARIRRQTTLKTGWTMMHRIRFERVKYDVPERQKRLFGG